MRSIEDPLDGNQWRVEGQQASYLQAETKISTTKKIPVMLMMIMALMLIMIILRLLMTLMTVMMRVVI